VNQQKKRGGFSCVILGGKKEGVSNREGRGKEPSGTSWRNSPWRGAVTREKNGGYSTLIGGGCRELHQGRDYPAKKT